MESITTPQVINMPFCAEGDKNTIPSAATGTQRASLEEGFPEITSKPTTEGGIPPEREDFNGAMNLNSQFYFAFQNGWWPTFDADVSAAIGGYPLGAVLWWFPTTGNYANMAVPLKSLVANNTYNFNTNSSYVGVYWKPLYKDPNALPIGTVFMHQSSNAADVPGALPLFTGETIANADQLYPDFYDWVADHSELQISAENYETALSTYGECPKYVIDTTNHTIRLPKLANYLKMANTTDGIAQASAGLPNITGWFGANVNDGTQWSGAFYKKDTSDSGSDGGSGGGHLGFDASNSNSIYGNSNTVTPAHTTLFPWVCAYNTAVAASVAQAAEFQTALSGKADTTLINITSAAGTNLNAVGVRTVVETYISGTSWYRIWSDGWLEQGGYYDNGSNARSFTGSVSFTKNFSVTSYSLSLCPMRTGTSTNLSMSCGAGNRTVSGFDFSAYGNSTDDQARYIVWRAEGPMASN